MKSPVKGAAKVAGKIGEAFEVDIIPDDPGDVVRLLGDAAGVGIMVTGEVGGGAAVVAFFEAVHAGQHLIHPDEPDVKRPKK